MAYATVFSLPCFVLLIGKLFKISIFNWIKVFVMVRAVSNRVIVFIKVELLWLLEHRYFRGTFRGVSLQNCAVQRLANCHIDSLLFDKVKPPRTVFCVAWLNPPLTPILWGLNAFFIVIQGRFQTHSRYQFFNFNTTDKWFLQTRLPTPLFIAQKRSNKNIQKK